MPVDMPPVLSKNPWRKCAIEERSDDVSGVIVETPQA